MIEVLLQAESALSFGMLDRAETLYRQVAAADPRNAMALVGLARVALERGDELSALAEGRRALEIDAENMAARRLVERLEEVRRFRGEEGPEAPAAGADPQAAAPGSPAAEATHVSTAPATPPAAPPIAAPADDPSSPAARRSLLDRLLRRS